MHFGSAALETALLAWYYSILGVLAIFGMHRVVLVVGWFRTRHHRVETPPEPSVWPRVTVQLPLYNEMYVAERLIDAVARLDYPSDRLEIQVLDDSTDETVERVAERVAHHRQRGVDIHHLHRTDRSGFKAGALAAGLETSAGELIAVFDADFVPDADFLMRSVPFFADPDTGRGLGMVQGCWAHLNRSYSLLTRIQAIFLDGHFLIEHTARNRTGCFFNFNGTAGIWHRQAIEDAGGWTQDTLTEDLDLSYRAQLAGWRFLFLPDLKVPSELPVDINGFKSQQYRWAKGSIQTGRKLLSRILRSRQPLRIKFEAMVHLTNNLSYPLMVLLAILVFPAMILRRGSEVSAILLIDLPMFMAATISVLVFYSASQIAQGPGWPRRLLDLPALMGVGIGLAINNARAALSGLFQRGGTFVRTPKYRIEGLGLDWRRLHYRAGQSFSFVIEGLFALYFLITIGLAWWWGMWLSIPFLYLFLQGYGYMFLLTVVPGLGHRAGAPAESGDATTPASTETRAATLRS